ncbi:hypothetical protein [Govanella unica]|uniref:Uncharacterized protein n=1 Tax=Govanella unica TaxID=2975056 RepID=A0A9X3Z705_9PROT|nr:hypothetical protein [Govania unica]MDA5193666.1 hypothetical protein [Govania unica]
MRFLLDDFGGSYIWSATVIRDGSLLTIKGVSQMPENRQALATALRVWCRDNGIEHVEWERHKERVRKMRYAVRN